MRAAKLLCVLMTLLLGGGCASGADTAADRIREHYAGKTEGTYTVTLRTDFGDRVLDFMVEYAYTPVGGRMKVLSPEPVAGIEAELEPDGVTLRYDGTVLELGALPGTGLSPMESLPFIIAQWAGGYITQTGSETRTGQRLLTMTTLETQGETALEARTWFDRDTLEPLTAELLVNGALTVTAYF